MENIEKNRYGKKWTEEETILAFYYYCQLPFGQLGCSNKEIVRVAKLLDRTPDALALKMFNLAHFDPVQQKRNIKGMKNTSKTDELIVSKYYGNWDELSEKAHEIESRLSETIDDEQDEIITIGDICVFPQGTTKEQIIKARNNQTFFRKAVLSAYNNCCCITGISIPSLLIASHIKPWKDSSYNERTNPSNGLCLNALHDKAFDKGLITILKDDYTILVSSKLKEDKTYNEENFDWIRKYNKKEIMLPEKFLPSREFLEYHNDVIFKG